MRVLPGVGTWSERANSGAEDGFRKLESGGDTLRCTAHRQRSLPALHSSDGRAAWEKLHSRVSKGTIEIPAMNNLSGTIEVRMKAPNLILVVINLGGAIIQQGFDGTSAWSDDPRNGLRVLTGGELEDERKEANFYHALDLQKIYSKFTVTGREKIDDHDTYVVEASPAGGGDPDKLYFDTQSGLEVRSVNHRHTPDGSMEFSANIADYRELDGVKLPFRVEQASSQAAFTITFTDIQHNVDLPDSLFTKPSGEPPAGLPAQPPADSTPK
jgi:photosynthetic reaction center cytochrome c subunit